VNGSSIIFDQINETQRSAGSEVQVPERPIDPMLSRTDLKFHAMFYPLGFAVEIATNDRAVLAAANESWGGMNERYVKAPLLLEVIVTDDEAVACPPAPVARARGHLYSMIADAENQIICDMTAGVGFICIGQTALRHSSYLRYFFLEAAVYTLIGALHATPLHAACVSRNGHGLLFCGNSGAGKSTLAYACARAGWTYTSDDSTSLLRGTLPNVIGNSRKVRFRPSARELFPELAGRDLTPRAEGKPSVEVPSVELPNLIISDEATIHSIVFLNRQRSADAVLLPLPRASAIQYFDEALFPDHEVHARQMAALDALATASIYELRYDNLGPAIDCLEQLTQQGDPFHSQGIGEARK
jgi:hypothetical protein